MLKKFTVLTLLLACGTARAQETSLTLGLTSGVVTRGIQLGRGGPAVQASATYYSPQMWFASLSGATLGAPWNQAGTQVLGKLGHVWRFSPDWGAQLDFSYYTYPFDSPLRQYEHNELGTMLAYRDLVFMSVSGQRSTHAEVYGHSTGLAYDLIVRYPLRADLALDAGIGHQQVQHRPNFGYTYGQIGLNARIDTVQLAVAYIATSDVAKTQFGSNASDRWTASLTWSF
jgi:uncharacterized protein (TIGR02001 family)